MPADASLTTKLTATQAEAIALTFVSNEWELSEDDRDWFTVLSSRFVGESWYVVELGIEGLPDKWVFQVYDTGVCDPNYTFVTPVSASELDTGLSDFPEHLAEVVTLERRNWLVSKP
ncbi:hypothetical protein HC928_22290 [bacterium]|nr:hypothetical protein [bacterium]